MDGTGYPGPRIRFARALVLLSLFLMPAVTFLVAYPGTIPAHISPPTAARFGGLAYLVIALMLFALSPVVTSSAFLAYISNAIGGGSAGFGMLLPPVLGQLCAALGLYLVIAGEQMAHEEEVPGAGMGGPDFASSDHMAVPGVVVTPGMVRGYVDHPKEQYQAMQQPMLVQPQ